MSNEPDNVNPKMEPWLRQWGAAQARREAEHRTLPSELDAPEALPVTDEDAAVPAPITAPMPPPRHSLWPAVRQWAPLAAAAVLLIVWGWLLSVREKPPGPGPVTSDPAGLAATTPTDRETQLADQLDESRRRVAELEQTVDAQRAAMDQRQAELSQLRDAAKADREALAAMTWLDDEVNRLGETLANEQAARTEIQAAYTRLHVQFDEQREKTASATASASAAWVSLDRCLTLSQQETQRTRYTYFAALADSPGGIRAAQQAVVKGRFLQRLATERRQANSDTAALMDRIEVAAISLSTLALDDAQAVETFRKQLADWELDAAIAEALQVTPGVETQIIILRETQMIFEEAGRDEFGFTIFSARPELTDDLCGGQP